MLTKKTLFSIVRSYKDTTCFSTVVLQKSHCEKQSNKILPAFTYCSDKDKRFYFALHASICVVPQNRRFVITREPFLVRVVRNSADSMTKHFSLAIVQCHLPENMHPKLEIRSNFKVLPTHLPDLGYSFRTLELTYRKCLR